MGSIIGQFVTLQIIILSTPISVNATCDTKYMKMERFTRGNLLVSASGVENIGHGTEKKRNLTQL